MQKWFVFAFAFLLYANTLSHQYTLDDHFVIRGNWMVEEGFDGIGDLLTTDYWEGPLGDNKVSKLYRPLSLVTFAIEKQIVGFNPAFSHFINVALFAFCCLLLFQFLKRFLSAAHPYSPLLIALLFAAHPLHTESVANLKGRAEILAALFLFASLLYLLDWLEKKEKSRLIVSALLFFLGLLSKEDAITFLAVVPLVAWFKLPNTGTGRRILHTGLYSIPYLVAAATMLLLRNHYADDPEKSFSYIENPLEALTGAEYFFNAMMVSGQYLKQILWPLPLIHDYSFNQIPLTKGPEIHGILAVLILAGFVFFGIKYTLKGLHSGFAFLFFIITFSVASNLFVTIGVMKAERLMFIPLLGIMMLLVFLWEKYFTRYGTAKSLMLGLPVFVIMSYGFMTVDRNKDWKDNETLLEADIDKSPRNVKVKSNYAAILRNRSVQAVGPEKDRLMKESARHLWESIEVAPDYNRPWIDLGYLFEMRGMTDSAVYVFSEALKLNPTDNNLVRRIDNLKVMTDTAFIRGNNLVNAERYPEAIAVFDSLIKVYPESFEPWFYLGGVSFNSGNYQKALQAWEKAKQISPNDPRIDEPLGHARKATGSN